MRSNKKEMRYKAFILAAVIFVLDLISKWVVETTSWLHYYPVVQGLFTIEYVTNEGIAFGLLHSVESQWKPVLLSVAALLAIGVVIYFILTTTPTDRLSLVSLGLLLGGVLGNFTDRVLNRHVVDFLKVHWQDQIAWPTFNLADSAITVGVVLLLLTTLIKRPPRKTTVAASLLLLIPAIAAATVRPDQIVDSLQQRYEKIETLSASFTQIHESRGIRLRESGVLLMEKPGRMYWEYKEPRTKFFVADGQQTIFYVPAENQAFVARFDPDEAHSPLLFLLGRGDIRRDFNVRFSEAEPTQGLENYVLRLDPRTPHPEFLYLLLEVEPQEYRVERLVVVEPVGTRNEYILSEMEENVKIPEKRFKLDLPANVEIVER